MPYIEPSRRPKVWAGNPENEGDLNFKITHICLQYLGENGTRYQHINKIVGVLERFLKSYPDTEFPHGELAQRINAVLDRYYADQLAKWNQQVKSSDTQEHARQLLEFEEAIVDDIAGALRCCQLEFYRRRAGPYEDTKIKENGDIYA